jgi:hypothetical protein
MVKKNQKVITPNSHQKHLKNSLNSYIMQKIYLRRQGSSGNFNTNNNLSLPFHINIQDNRLTISGNDLTLFKIGPLSFEECKAMAVAKVKEHFDIDIEISSQIEAYIPHNGCNNDIYLATCIFETYSNTIRSIPENYCLICWENDDINRPVFNMDGAVTEDIRNLCREAHAEFLKPHNQRKTDQENKTWLCWYISEGLKEMGKAPYLVPTLCNDTQLHQSFIKA